jgi:hypothetical protein
MDVTSCPRRARHILFFAGLTLLLAVGLVSGWGAAAEREPQAADGPAAELAAAANWTLLSPSGWTTRPSTISVLANDSDGLTPVTAFFRYSTDSGGTWSTWLGIDTSVAIDANQVQITKITSALIDSASANQVQFRITDKSSNIEVSPAYTIAVDSLPPTTTASTVPTWPAQGWFSSTVTINLAASDILSGVATTYWRLQSGLWHTGTVFSVSASGTYEYYAIDQAGNQETAHPLTIQIDSAAPTLTVSTAPSEPASGWYRTPVTVTLSAQDTLSGLDGAAWYTLDGGPAQTGDTVVVTGSGTHVVRAYARDLAGNLSQRQVNIKIDSNPPVTTHSFSPALPAGGWFNSAVTVLLAATDDLSTVQQTLYRSGTGLWHPGIQFVVTEYSTYNYKSIDQAGNEETEKQVVVPIDNVPPVSSYQLSPLTPAKGWYSSTVSVTITATDDRSGWTGDTRYRVNGGAEQAGATFALSADGSYSLSFYSRDVAGNVEDAKTADPLCRIDNTPPTVNPVPDKTGVYIKPPVDVHLQASDGHSGIDYVQFRKQGDPAWTNYDHIVIPGTAADGVYTYQYRAFDRAGHVTAGLISLNIDGTAPLAPSSAAAIPSGWTNRDRFGLSWLNPSDFSGISGVYYQMDIDPTISRNGQLVQGEDIRDLTNLTVSTEGAHDVYLWLVDGAGNESHWTRYKLAQGFKLDTTPPTSIAPTISGPLNNGFYTGPVNVTFRGTDNLSGIQSFRYLVNGTGAPLSVPIANPSIVISQDERSIIASWAIDQAGNTQTYSQTDTIRIDTIAPAAPINPLVTPATWTKTNSFAVAWVNPLDYSGVKAVYLKKGSAPTSRTDGQRIDLAGSASLSGITAPSQGETRLYLWLEDLAGNANHNVAQSVVLRYDATAPQTAITPSGTVGLNGYYVSAVTVSLAGTDAASGVDEVHYRTRRNNGAWGNWTVWSGGGLTLSQEGVHDIAYYATDHAGNEETPAKTATYKIDLTAPGATAMTTADYTEGTCFDVAWSGSDRLSGIDRYQVQYRQGKLRAWQDWQANTAATSGAFCSAEANKFYYFRVKTWDKAGWESPWSQETSGSYAYREGLANRSFDLCDYGAWNKTGTLGGDIVYVAAHGGGSSCLARLGQIKGPDDFLPINAYSGVNQTINLPALDDSEGLVLSFWYRIQTYDVAWGKDEADGQYKFFDPFRVYVRSTAGAELAGWLPAGNLTDPDKWNQDQLYDSGWWHQVIDLTPWAGQLVQLDFRIWSLVDPQYPSWAFVDDVKLLPKPGRFLQVPLVFDYNPSYVPPASASPRLEVLDATPQPDTGNPTGKKSRK